MATPRHVSSTDGVRLAVYESGDPGATTVLAVHGYPDNHTVWDGVSELLAERFHVVTYDVRGTGQSDQPAPQRAYRMDRLVDDLGAVLDAVSPDAPVHLLAHDWGSVQCWPALTDERFAGRIASFTSISGPSLDHAAAWLRRAHRHPRAAARQLLDSYYIALFQLPVLPEAIMRSRRVERLLAAAGRVGSSAADRTNGLKLYRANMLPRLGRPRPERIDVPVQVLAPSRDAFVSPRMQLEAPAPYVADLTARRISGRHWVLAERPDVIARCTAEFIGCVENGAAAHPNCSPSTSAQRPAAFSNAISSSSR
ncbi:MAG: alpha/beta fold hydrolase [Jatrophihabitantaceae bacterium]